MALLRNPIGTSGKQAEKVRTIVTAESSYLESVSYDSSTFQMTITFKNGAQYIHFFVFPAVFEEFAQASSKGQFYSRNIKGKYQGNRVIDKRSPVRQDPLKTDK